MGPRSDIGTVLTSLGIDASNPAACSTPGNWLRGERQVLSLNPSTGEPIASAGACSAADYEAVMTHALESQRVWRDTPAPRRGETVRAIGDALRRNKSALGTLISFETGKIKAEGDGEVQEMIDIADFAVGQSRMLYGLTMHSERPRHRMYEQWHPLGVVGVITAFNFPVAVWAWNAFIAAVCGNVTVWKPSPKAPLCALAVQHIVNRVLEDMREYVDAVFPGDAADRRLLDGAGINRASSVLLTTNDDAMNIYLAVYCRRLNPALRIVSRITLERNVEAIHRAGADFVLSYTTLGIEAVMSLLRGYELVLLGEGVELFSIPVPPSLAGHPLRDTGIGSRTGMSVVALQIGERVVTPLTAETLLPEQAALLMLGSLEQRKEFGELFEKQKVQK